MTGFDARACSTIYLDKPMRGHGLMQAIARLNRVFRDKPGGLVVDYLGIARELKEALETYTASGGRGRTALDQEEAVAVMLEKYEVCCDLFHGFDWSKWTTGTAEERLGLLPAAQEHILAQENGKDRFIQAVRELSKAFALAVPHEEAIRIRDDVGFFQAVQSVLAKRTLGDPRPEEDLDHAIRQIVARAIAPEGVIDVFAAAGLKKPDISILSEEFLAEVRGMPQKNLAVELLRKLLQGEIRTRSRKNLVQSRSFAEMLEQSVRRYQNRTIEAAQVIEELIALAREMREANARGEKLTHRGGARPTTPPRRTTARDSRRRDATPDRAGAGGHGPATTSPSTDVRETRARPASGPPHPAKHGYPPDKQEKARRR